MPSDSYQKQYSDFLQKLKSARHDVGLSQYEVADMLGKHQSYVSKCETGERRVDIVELCEFANLYGKPISYFISIKET